VVVSIAGDGSVRMSVEYGVMLLQVSIDVKITVNATKQV
jgi:thiamine pyrophosphate-dependent acetolactate synthase large subunit-like protein